MEKNKSGTGIRRQTLILFGIAIFLFYGNFAYLSAQSPHGNAQFINDRTPQYSNRFNSALFTNRTLTATSIQTAASNQLVTTNQITVSGGEWPSFIFNDKDSRYQAKSTINSSNVAQLKEKWMITTHSSITATPVVLNGTVYFADWSGNVYAANVAAGTVKWKTNLGSSISSTPELYNGSVYVGFGPLGVTKVTALSQKDGHIIWTSNLNGTMKAVWASPSIFNGILYIGTSSSDAQGESNVSVKGRLYALNAATGKAVWIVNTSGTAGGAAIWGSVVYDPQLNAVYFGTGNSYVAGNASPNTNTITSNDFRFYSTCASSSSLPSYSGGTYLVPYPPAIPSGCSNDLNDIDQVTSQQQKGFLFTGTFGVNGISNLSSDEEVVMAVDDVANWTGQGYGFRTSLSNNTIYSFVQDGTKLANGWTFFETVPLMHNDGKQHNFKITVTSNAVTSNSFHNIINFYIDGTLLNTITRDSAANYSSQQYHIIMTTHRWDSGWNSGNSLMSVRNISLSGENTSSAQVTTKYAYSVVSLNATTGSANWFYQIYNSFTIGGDKDFGSTPNLFSMSLNGMVFKAVGIGGKNGVYYVLNRRTGTLIESYALPSTEGIIGVGGYYYLSANTLNPQVYVPIYKNGKPDFTNSSICCGHLQAIYPSLGSKGLAWNFNASSNLLGSMALVPGAVVFGDIGGHVYAVSAQTGNELYKVNLPAPVFGGVSVAEGHVFVPTAFDSDSNTLGIYAFSTT